MRFKQGTGMKLAGLSTLALGLMMGAGQQAEAATIYEETFSGLSSTDLSGTAPDTTTGGELWSASTDWNKDGSTDGSAGFDNAFLAFTPTTGKIYTLSATLQQPTGTQDRWAAIGFTEGDSLNNDFWDNISDATVPWVLYRVNSQVVSFTGRSSNWTLAGEGNFTGPITLSIELNTQGANWTAEWFVNGGSVRSDVLASNPTGITHVGLGRRDGAAADFDSFSLTVVPEPGSLLVGTVGIAGLCLRRRRSGK